MVNGKRTAGSTGIKLIKAGICDYPWVSSVFNALSFTFTAESLRNHSALRIEVSPLPGRGCHCAGDSLRTDSVMYRNAGLTTRWIVRGRHDANEFHHPSIFVGKDVAVKNERADKVHVGLPDSDPARCDIRNLAA